MTILEKIEVYNQDGWDITLSISGGHLNAYVDKNDPEDRPYYCDLYYGDSNSPWKPGTKHGIGWGWTLEEAVLDAEKNIKVKV